MEAGLKRDLVLNVTIWPLSYNINAKISPVFADMYRIPKKFWTHWAVSMPPWTPRENDQASTYLGNLNFDIFGPHPESKRAHILHTSTISFYVLISKFYVSPMETFCQTDGNLIFHPLWRYLGSKRIQNYGPWEPIFHTLRVVPVSLKTSFSWIHWKPYAK